MTSTLARHLRKNRIRIIYEYNSVNVSENVQFKIRTAFIIIAPGEECEGNECVYE